MRKKMKRINLPLGEAVNRSFAYVFAHIDSLAKMCVLWLLLVVLFDCVAGFQTLCTSDDLQCMNHQFKWGYIFVSYIAGISISVALIRKVLLNENLEMTLNFGKREIKYIFWSLLIVLSIALITFLCGTIFNLLLNKQVAMNLGVLVGLALLVYSSRLLLIFPAIATDNQNMNLKLSFELTKGNITKIVLGIVVVALPSLIVLNLLGNVYLVFKTDNFIIKLCFSALINMVIFFDAILKTSFVTHMYQYFCYVYKKQSEQ